MNIRDNTDFKDYLDKQINTNFTFRSINEQDVGKIIDSLPSKSSYGEDGISPKLLKSLKSAILKSFTLIINQILHTGIFPEHLKIARVLPLFKKDDQTIFSNYRPISLLPSFSKVVEKIIFNQLYEYFDSHKYFYSSQYGFRKCHSTEHAALELIDKIITDMDKGNIPINIYLDMSKAFDILDHRILIDKLKYYGITGTALDLFISYLSNRKQYVDFKGIKSNTLDIKSGVPQGSILGPLLFIIFINDFSKSSNLFDFIIYADDTSLSSTLKDKYPNFEVGLKCILMVNPYLLVCSYIK